MFSQFAKQKRLENNLTQHQCSRALCYKNRSTFQRLETGKIKWSLDDLQNFADLLNVKLSELIAEYENQ